MCRREAQAEYTNPAAAWHQTHMRTHAYTKTEVTANTSLKKERETDMNMENNQHSPGKLKANLRERLALS